MKTILSVLGRFCIVATTLAATSALSQISSPPQSAAGSASTGVSVSIVNGQGVVTLNGREVYRGPTSGAVASRSSNINGVEYSAVFDGDKVLWENVPGAAARLQSAGGGAAGLDHKQLMEQHQQAVSRMQEEQRRFLQAHGGTQAGGSLGAGGGSAGQSSLAGVTTRTVNGSTVIGYGGQEVSVGPTKGKLSSKIKSSKDGEYAAAFENERVIWENVPGAALQLR
jgi:hypothetical protein